MGGFGGFAGGAISGAKAGSVFGPWGAGIGGAIGGIAGAFSGREDPAVRFAKQQMMKQQERANQFWTQAQGQMGKAESYFAPIAGGSRQAALEAVAPEVQGATQRLDTARKSLLNLSSRSGGAAGMIDPYAKAGIASNILQKVRPQAAAQMAGMAQTTGGWAQGQGAAAKSIMDYGTRREDQAAQRGASMYDSLEGALGNLKDWWGSRKKAK